MSEEQEALAPFQMHKAISMCMNCHGEGETRFMLTSIPFYKEVLISSFECFDCKFRENSVTSAAGLAPECCEYKLKVDPVMCEHEEVLRDLSRTVVRTETSTIKIPEIGFEIAPNRTEIITVEGLLLNITDSLSVGQEERKVKDPESHEKIENIIETLEQMRAGNEEFTLIIEDPAGHAFISNPYVPSTDPRCVLTKRKRTPQEVIALGFTAEDERLLQEEHDINARRDQMLNDAMKELRLRENREKRKLGHGSSMKLTTERGDGYKSGGSKSGLKVMSSKLLNKKDLDKFETLSEAARANSVTMEGICHSCASRNETRMCIVDIPYFGPTIIICTDCLKCHYKSTEIKPGGGIAERGIRIKLNALSPEDLTRDVLKSEEAEIQIPELDLVLQSGTLGGKFTSVEGILTDIKNQIDGVKGFYVGDSSSPNEALRMNKFLKDIDTMIDGERPFTFIINDPIGNSFIEGRVDGEHDTSPFEDKQLEIEYYTRTPEMEEQLGIAGMKTEGYETIREGDEDDDDDEDNDNDEDDDYESDDDEDDTDNNSEDVAKQDNNDDNTDATTTSPDTAEDNTDTTSTAS